MVSLLQISDTHFGTEQPLVVAALQRLARAQKPDVLLVTGDITQRAQPGQFAAARSFCDSLGIAQRVSLAGNHDIPLLNMAVRIFAPYRQYQKAFGDCLEPVLSLPEVLILAVKTTRRWRHSNGQISQAQVARVAADLQKATPGQLRLVLVHQPIHVVQARDVEDRLIGHEAAIAAWDQAGADIIMGGHIHVPYFARIGQDNGGAGGLWCVQAGTAVSSRVRSEAPNSVNLLRFDSNLQKPRCCTLERWDYAAASGEFERRETASLALKQPGFAANAAA